MRRIILLLTFVLSGTQVSGVVFALPSPNQEETFSRRPELGVLVLTSSGERISGASLKLCRVEGSSSGKRNENKAAESGSEKPCELGTSDQNGHYVFERLASGKYQLMVELGGFISASIGPMNIAAEDPAAPDEIKVLLNAACYDC